MHGKTTLILTDKDTGRVVERREEHNMVTNALGDIFSVPPEVLFNDSSVPLGNGFFPMYKTLLKGLVLFEENVPENAADYLFASKRRFLATAGDAYSGTLLTRGSFNENASCEIENGYRFVWDFAPEKAVGTIKCLGLTNRHFGNQSYSMIHPTNITDLTSAPIKMASTGQGTFFLRGGNDFMYSFYPGSRCITIYKYRFPNRLGLKICDKLSASPETTTKINLNWSPYANAAFYDAETKLLYVTDTSYYSNSSNERFCSVKYAVIDPVSGEKKSEMNDYIRTNAPWKSGMIAVIYNGKIHIAIDGTVHICNMSGVLEKTISSFYKFNRFVEIDGKIAMSCKLTSNGNDVIMLLDGSEITISNPFYGYVQLAFGSLSGPYVAARSTEGYIVGVMLRTDYLATINNLASPLVKTDQHALQVRYEVTNE